MPEPTQYSPDLSLTPAAEAVGIRRNTICNWRRTVPAFARETELALDERTTAWHDRALLLAQQALAVLHEMLSDPAAPPALCGPHRPDHPKDGVHAEAENRRRTRYAQ